MNPNQLFVTVLLKLLDNKDIPKESHIWIAYTSVLWQFDKAVADVVKYDYEEAMKQPSIH